jgi:hypothetical protein
MGGTGHWVPIWVPIAQPIPRDHEEPVLAYFVIDQPIAQAPTLQFFICETDILRGSKAPSLKRWQ